MLVLWWVVFAVWLTQVGGWVYYGPIKREWGEDTIQFAIITCILSLCLNLLCLFM